jgi:hypothetical protein
MSDETKTLISNPWRILDQMRVLTPGSIGSSSQVGEPPPCPLRDAILARIAHHDSPEYACGLDAALPPATERN